LTVCSPPACPVERIEQHLAAGAVHVDGESVTDPYASAPACTWVMLWAE
jgi:hypothetical protein